MQEQEGSIKAAIPVLPAWSLAAAQQKFSVAFLVKGGVVW